MARVRKQLLVAGIILLLLFAVLLGYACYGEFDSRTRVRAPSGTDYGFVPLDLLRGRTHFEKRVDGNVVFSADWGPSAEGRIAIARAAFGVGILGAALLVFRGFMKEQPKKDAHLSRAS